MVAIAVSVVVDDAIAMTGIVTAEPVADVVDYGPASVRLVKKLVDLVQVVAAEG